MVELHAHQYQAMLLPCPAVVNLWEGVSAISGTGGIFDLTWSI